MSKYAYPAIFKQEGKFYNVVFPDLPCATSGESIPDAMLMAEDALALLLYSYELKRKEIPKPSLIGDIVVDDGFVNYVICDTIDYAKKFNNKAVKKTLTIPEWLNEAAVSAGINFSQVLQDALKNKLKI